MWTQEHREIHHALNELAIACGWGNDDGMSISESRTERFFQVLHQAVNKVAADWSNTVDESHEIGLCYDVHAMLADALVNILDEADRAGRA